MSCTYTSRFISFAAAVIALHTPCLTRAASPIRALAAEPTAQAQQGYKPAMRARTRRKHSHSAHVHLAKAPRLLAATGVPSRSRSFQLAAAEPHSRTKGTTPARKQLSLQEIVISAEYRKERLVTTPVAVTVLSSSYLRNIGATQFRDWANTVPGLSFTSSGAGYTTIYLRGLTASDISPTVAVYVNDVPYGSYSPFALGYTLQLDLATVDLARIDVLKGPQGTLYGVSTMGGLIKYVTNPPDANDLGAIARATISGTHYGGVNYDSSLTLNVPIAGGKAAVRGTAFYNREGGYIDDPTLGQTDVNRSHTGGGRLDLLATPTDQLVIRISALAQDIHRSGNDIIDYTAAGTPIESTTPGYGPYNQNRAISEPFDQQFRLYSATLGYDGPGFNLTSITSYQTIRSQFQIDESHTFLRLFKKLGFNYSAVGFGYHAPTNKFTQEMRLASRHTRYVDWLVGAYYSRESSRETVSTITFDPSGASVSNSIYSTNDPSLYKEYAGYGDITLHVTPKFDMTGGIRYAHYSLAYDTSADSGLFALPEPPRSSAGNVTTYLGNARYHFTPNSISYFRYATGYRPGGPNFILVDPTTGKPEGPQTFQSDSLRSYELGYKVETPRRKFGIDADVYYITWSNIQTSVTLANSEPAIENAPGGAVSEGLELTADAHPFPSLVVIASLAATHAYLRQTDVDLGATAGEELPNAPRFSATLGGDYTFHTFGMRPSAGMTVRYVDARSTEFGGTWVLPAYTIVDLRAGLDVGPAVLQLFAHNIFDARGQISEGGPGIRVTLVEPRTIGMSATVYF